MKTNIFSQFASVYYPRLLDDQRDIISSMITPPTIIERVSFIDIFTEEEENSKLLENIDRLRKTLDKSAISISKTMSSVPKSKEQVLEFLKELESKLSSYTNLCNDYIVDLFEIVNAVVVQKTEFQNDECDTIFMTKPKNNVSWSWTFPLLLPDNNFTPMIFSMNKLELELSFFLLVNEIMTFKKTLVNMHISDVSGDYRVNSQISSKILLEQACRFEILTNKFTLDPETDGWVVDEKIDLTNFTAVFKNTTKFFSVVCELISRTSLLTYMILDNQCSVKDIIVPQNEIVVSLQRNMNDLSLFDAIDFDKKLLVSFWQILGDSLTFHDSLLKLFISIDLISVREDRERSMEEINSIAFLLLSTCLNFPVQHINNPLMSFLKNLRSSNFVEIVKNDLISETKCDEIKKMAQISNKKFNSYWIEQIYGKGGVGYSSDIYLEWEFTTGFKKDSLRMKSTVDTSEKESLHNFEDFTKQNPIFPIKSPHPFKNDSRLYFEWFIGEYTDFVFTEKSRLLSYIKPFSNIISPDQFTSIHQYKEQCYLKTNKFTYSNAQLLSVVLMIDFCYTHKTLIIPSRLEIEKAFSFYNSCLFYNVYINSYELHKVFEGYITTRFKKPPENYPTKHSLKNRLSKWMSVYEKMKHKEDIKEKNFVILPPLVDLTTQQSEDIDIKKITSLFDIELSLTALRNMRVTLENDVSFHMFLDKKYQQIEDSCESIATKREIHNKFVSFIYYYFSYFQSVNNK